MTTATALSFTLLSLLTNPTAYTRLQRELDTAYQSNHLSTPIATLAEAHALPYLQAVIREGLRMYPPTTGLGSKTVPPAGDVVSGFALPAGTQVGANYFGVMRDRGVWGDDADVFRPERWIEAGDERGRVMNAVVDLEFGVGKYACLGKPVAVMELNKAVVEVSFAPIFFRLCEDVLGCCLLWSSYFFLLLLVGLNTSALGRVWKFIRMYSWLIESSSSVGWTSQS